MAPPPPPGPPQAASAADDPGFLRSLPTGTVLARTRQMMAMLLAAPVLIGAIMPFIVREGTGRLGELRPWLLLPPVAAAGLTVLAGRRTPRPMPAGLAPEAAVRAAMALFRQAVMVRFALAEGVVLLGVPLSVLGRSELPFVVSFALGYPLLLWLALPTRGNVERIRARLEAGGTDSRLWAVLLAPAPGPGLGKS